MRALGARSGRRLGGFWLMASFSAKGGGGEALHALNMDVFPVDPSLKGARHPYFHTLVFVFCPSLIGVGLGC